MSDRSQKIVRRNKLWFDKYDHMIRIYLPEACCLRDLDHHRIDRMLDMREQWGQKLTLNNPGSWQHGWRKISITSHMRESLHAMADFLLSESDNSRVTLTGDWLYIYSKGPRLNGDIKKLAWLDQHKISTGSVELSGPRDAVLLKSPERAWRSYLRGRLTDAAMLARLRNLLLSNTTAKPSRSLKECLDRNWTRLHDYYYIDHDEESFLTVLALISPGLVRKTLPILEHK